MKKSDNVKVETSETVEMAPSPKRDAFLKRDTLLEGDLIWNEIKNKEFSLFGLPSQTVESYFKKKFTTGDCLVMSPSSKASAAVSVLDALLNKAKSPTYAIDVMQDGNVRVAKVKP